MKLLVGLGNPGAKYARNRHNIGFMMLDELQERAGRFEPWKTKFQGRFSKGVLGDEQCILLKPSTYMNESGRSVAEAARFFRIDSGDIIVFHDELDLLPGKMKVKKGGGHAGHNGLRSIIAQAGGPDFVRVRIGIGHPGSKELVSGYVLHDFSRADQDWMEPLIDAMGRSCDQLVQGDAPRFMNDVARWIAPDKEKGGGQGSKKSPVSGKKVTGGASVKRDRKVEAGNAFVEALKKFGQKDD